MHPPIGITYILVLVEIIKWHLEEAVQVVAFGIELEFSVKVHQDRMYQAVFPSKDTLREELWVENR